MHTNNIGGPLSAHLYTTATPMHPQRGGPQPQYHFEVFSRLHFYYVNVIFKIFFYDLYEAKFLNKFYSLSFLGQ